MDQQPQKQEGADARALGDERRRHARFFDEVRIRFRDVAREEFTSWGEARDLSIGGACLWSDVGTEINGHLALEIHLERDRPPVLALARVLRCDAQGAGYRSGLEFLWLGEEDQESLQEFAAYCRERLS